MKRFVLLFFSFIAVYACTPENDFSGEQASGNQCVVEFSPVTVSTPAVTRGTAYIPKDSKMIIAAYGVVNGKEKTNFADTVNYIVSNTVGTIKPTGQKGMILYNDSTYCFYGYSPAIAFKANSTKALNVNNGIDFILTSTQTTFNKFAKQEVQLPAMDHQCSYVDFTISLNPANTDITKLELDTDGIKMTRLSHSPMEYTLGKGFNRSGVALDATCNIAGMAFTETETNTYKGGMTVLPKNSGSIDLIVNVLLNDKRYIATGTIPAMTLEPGKKYLFDVTFADGGLALKLTVLPWNKVTDSGDYGESTVINVTNWNVKENDATDLGDANNLSSGKTANCYIVPLSNRAYKFNATVMGNGATTLQSVRDLQTAPAIVPVTLNPQSAFVLWETGSKGSVIADGSVTLSNGFVRFNTANNTINGNAVIAVKGVSGDIIWSWHIWKVNYNPETNYDTYSKYPAGSAFFKMMKYNLGATDIGHWSASAENAGDLGLLYQWGRKDPFPGASGWTNWTVITRTFADGYSFAAVSAGSSADVSIANAIKSPHHFIKQVGTSTYDWVSSDYATQRDNLWGNPNTTTSTTPNPSAGSKSIYDPCPPGWRVPPQDYLQIFKSDGQDQGDWNTFGGTNKGNIFYIAAWQSGDTSYWPALGYIAKEDGTVKSLGGYDPYWNSSSSVDYKSGQNITYKGWSGFFNSIYNWNNGVFTGSCRGDGYPIRCTKE